MILKKRTGFYLVLFKKMSLVSKKLVRNFPISDEELSLLHLTRNLSETFQKRLVISFIYTYICILYPVIENVFLETRREREKEREKVFWKLGEKERERERERESFLEIRRERERERERVNGGSYSKWK